MAASGYFVVQSPTGVFVLVPPMASTEIIPFHAPPGSRCPIYSLRSDTRPEKVPVGYMVPRKVLSQHSDLMNGTPYGVLRAMKARRTASRRSQTGGGITSLTEIQEKVLAPALNGKDIFAKSKTGSGKTLAFLIPCVEQMAARPGPGGTLILTPTRELAEQIAEAAVELCRPHDMRVQSIIGGESSKPSQDVEGLERAPHVIVATPGRLKGLLTEGRTAERTLRALAPTRFFVLDEADRMIDPSFLPVVTRIRATMTTVPQTFLFSATFPSGLDDLIHKKRILRPGYETVDVVGQQDTAAVPTTITQRVVVAPIEHHLDLISAFVAERRASRTQAGGKSTAATGTIAHLSPATQTALRTWQDNAPRPREGGFKVMVFLGAQLMVDYASKVVRARCPTARIWTLHGGMSQKERAAAYAGFRTGSDDFLFTTDASARGVDFPGVTHVLQTEYTNPDEYRQRLGRTGRAGRSGEGVLFLDPAEESVVGRNPAIPADAVTRPPPPAGAPPADERLAKLGDKAFRAWLGGLKSRWRSNKLDREAVVNMALRMGRRMGARADEARVRAKL